MLEWCSIADTNIRSPGFKLARPQEAATKLILSVVPRVQIICFASGAFKNLATLVRAASNFTVARSANACAPR